MPGNRQSPGVVFGGPFTAGTGGMMAQDTVGLVIRTGHVELLVMEGRRVASSVRVPMEGEEPQHLTQAIHQAVAASRLKVTRLAVSVEHPGVLFRSFTLPILPKAEWDAAVQFEARRYIPFKTESLLWDYHAVSSSTAKRIEVVFAAIPREVFRALQESLAAAGIHPTVVEPRSLSLARLAEPAKGGSANDAVCLVDVEQDTAHLAIVKSGVPHLTRDISLVPRLDLPPSNPAETGAGIEPPPPVGVPVPSPREGGGDPLEAQAASAAGDPRVQRLLSELSVSMDFFMREYPSTRIVRVVLFGAKDLIDAWCERLSGQLVCPAEAGSDVLAQRVSGDLELSFASAAGLLARGNGRGTVQLDFLKRSLTKAPGARRAFASGNPLIARLVASLNMPPQAAACAALVVGFLLVLWVSGSLRVGAARRQLQQLAAARQELNGGLSQLPADALVPLKEQTDAQVILLKTIMEQRVSLAAKLDALAHSLPDGVWLTGLTFEDPMDPVTGRGRPRLLVEGACLLGETGKELRAIQAFEDTMQRNPRFVEGFSTAQLDQISVESSPSSQYTYRTFQLNCQSERRL